MRYIYTQDGQVQFVQRDHNVYDEEGQFLTNMKIMDKDVYSGTEYVGYILQDIFYPSENFNETGEEIR